MYFQKILKKKTLVKSLLLLFLWSNLQGTLEINQEIRKHLKKAPESSHNHDFHNIDCVYMINLDRKPERWEKSSNQLKEFGINPLRFSGFDGWNDLSSDIIHDLGVKYDVSMECNIRKALRTHHSFWLHHGYDGFAATSFNHFSNIELSTTTWDDFSSHSIIDTPGKVYFCHSMCFGQIGCALSHISVLQDAYDKGYETIWIFEDDITICRNPNVVPELIKILDANTRGGWDILFTDIDYRDNNSGELIPCRSFAPRPNYYPKDPNKFSERKDCFDLFTKIGARYGAHSMILRRSGIEKILNYIYKYKIFLPYDFEMCMPHNIQMYCLQYDLITQEVGSDCSTASPL